LMRVDFNQRPSFNVRSQRNVVKFLCSGGHESDGAPLFTKKTLCPGRSLICERSTLATKRTERCLYLSGTRPKFCFSRPALFPLQASRTTARIGSDVQGGRRLALCCLIDFQGEGSGVCLPARRRLDRLLVASPN
jgi:hypothetical protein